MRRRGWVLLALLLAGCAASAHLTNVDRVIERLKAEAAALGANGLLLQSVEDQATVGVGSLTATRALLYVPQASADVSPLNAGNGTYGLGTHSLWLPPLTAPPPAAAAAPEEVPCGAPWSAPAGG